MAGHDRGDGLDHVAAVCLLWPGIGTSDPDAALPAGFEGQRFQFEVLVLLPIIVVFAASTTYHLLAHKADSPLLPGADVGK